MRAMMSDRTERNRLLSNLAYTGYRVLETGCMMTFGEHGELEASQEAARILEQTEPVPAGYRAAECRYLGPARWTVKTDDGMVLLPLDDAEVALADSLRAFDIMTIDDLAALQTTR
jgi:hypothetical protein